MSARLFWLGAAAAVVTTGCGASVQSWVRPDYAATDQQTVKRLALQVRGVPADQQRMWTLMARRYINQHKNFIMRPAELPADATLGTACAGKDGVLGLDVQAAQLGADVQLRVQARIDRCRDGQAMWTGAVQGKWPSDEPTVAELRAHYVTELGQSIEAFVAPAFLAIKALVPRLPDPVLSGDDEMEKIEIGE